MQDAYSDLNHFTPCVTGIVASLVLHPQIASLSNILISTASPCMISRIYTLKSRNCASMEKYTISNWLKSKNTILKDQIL